MSEFFHTGRFFQQDAERTRTEQLERQKQEQRYLGSATRLPVTRRAVKVQYNPDCVYLQALNNRNAMRKLVKAGYIKMVKQDGKGPHVED